VDSSLVSVWLSVSKAYSVAVIEDMISAFSGLFLGCLIGYFRTYPPYIYNVKEKDLPARAPSTIRLSVTPMARFS